MDACCDSRKLLNEILACIQDVILIIDLEGRIVFSSSVTEEKLGYTSRELIGQDLSIIFTPEDMIHFYPNLLYMARHNQAFEGELMLMKKNGARFYASMMLKAFHDAGQDRAIVAACIQDQNQQKQLEKSYNESHYEDLVHIANGIAHEIRNPLMGIGGFVNRLYKSDRLNRDHEQYYDYIIENIRKIEELVKKTENFANIPKPSLSNVFINEMVENILERFAPEIQKRKIGVAFDIPDLTLMVDRNQVADVFSILVANAIDAIEKNGKITIQTETDTIYAEISVSDTGTGISAKDLPHIFKPFFSTKPDRVGIDLAIVKRIMTDHDGSVAVRSEAGQGATFTLLFPLERRNVLRVSSLK